jgi:hypothetical protein
MDELLNLDITDALHVVHDHLVGLDGDLDATDVAADHITLSGPHSTPDTGPVADLMPTNPAIADPFLKLITTGTGQQVVGSAVLPLPTFG